MKTNQALVVKKALAAQHFSRLFVVVRPWSSSGHVTLYLICIEVAADGLARRRPNMINMLGPRPPVNSTELDACAL